MPNTIKVVKYNPEWPKMFAAEAVLIKQALGANCVAIHHIGSTAVPGLAAKPIIDIIPVVQDIMAVDIVTDQMTRLGYEAKGEYGMLFRRYFQKGIETRTHNVHVFEEDNAEIERHVKFRDWMRSHDEDKAAYAKLKAALALQHPHDMLSYCFGKDAFVASIDTKVGTHGFHIVNALTPREWEAVRNFRQTYFFDKINMADPDSETFEGKDQRHFILYQGASIIGYAHLQLWPMQSAALHMIFIDEAHRNQGIGGMFLSRCERWLKQQGMAQLHLQVSTNAYSFFQKYGYLEMPFNDPLGFASESKNIGMGKLLS